MALPERELKKITADEFFEMFPEESNSERYELHEGEIVAMASPNEQHQNIIGGAYSEIRAFIRKKGGKCKVMISPFDVKLTDTIVVQPDVLVVCDPSKMDGKRCNGAPDWVIEVTSTNKGDDFGKKLMYYQENGVREYWIVDPKNQKTLVYFWEKNDFPDIYTFDTPIPVEIYNRELNIQISELL
ncbi:MAG: Uma2 family endonuclease [Oscillospiraceae bacterium]